MTQFDPATSSLSYASQPVYVRAPSPLAGAAIIFGGLGLILLGGCFLIGVLLIVRPNFVAPSSTNDLTLAQVILMIFLYVMAFTCFAGAAVMLFVGTRGLLRSLRG
jgi:hypothetical protein